MASRAARFSDSVVSLIGTSSLLGLVVATNFLPPDSPQGKCSARWSRPR